jgi:DDE superfamily endonuclease
MKIALSENGWTNNALGLEWIKHFNTHTRSCVVGTYRLLILDGHDSHIAPEFDTFCTQNNIITLCMPAHASHILQPLDVGCFGALKTAYGTLVSDLARQRIFHVDKTDFLAMYIQAHTKIFTKDIIKNAFKATGIYPFNPGYVLDTLITTPSLPSTGNGMPTSSPWNSSTPLTLQQLEKQVKVVDSAIKEDQDYIEPLKKIVKATAHLMTKVALMDTRITDLEGTMQHLNKKQRRSKAQLQAGGVLSVEEAQDMIEQAELATQIAAEQRSQRAAPTCSLCHQLGHRRNYCPTIQVASN